MFKVIFKEELKFWRRNPVPYVFAIFLFALTMITMWGMAGEEVSGSNITIQNSPFRLNYLSNYICQLVVFMLPSIVGVSIFRDYGTKMYTILFSYPFTKSQYILAKFTSSFLVVILISSTIGFGFAIGASMPDVNPDAVIPFLWEEYIKLYLQFLIPNLFVMSIFIFVAVGATRNISVGFIAAIVMIIINLTIGSLSENIAALLDPLGKTAVQQATKFWTLSERNQFEITFSGAILWNRILWMSMGIMTGLLFLFRFKPSQFSNKYRNKKDSKTELTKSIKVQNIVSIPRINISFDFKSKLQLIWKLSNMDFRYIVLSWPFLVIVITGFFMVFIQQNGMAPQNGVAILPTTAEMLRIPVFIFSGTFNLLTFLYTGILIFRDRSVEMHEIIDTTPQPNWVFLGIKISTIIKMQFVLLTMALVSGVTVQTMQGYFRYELLHYLFELYFLQFIHFFIWACLAFFIHSLFKNMYVSFLLLFLIPIGILLLPTIGETLNFPLLKEHLLQFNHVPDLYVGFEYSDFNKYGSVLPVYFFYKLYWSVGAIIFILLALLIWRRGYDNDWTKRWQTIQHRFSGPLAWSIVVGVVAFICMGANVYYQEHVVSKTFFTDQDEDEVYAQNEIKYEFLLDKPQPKLAKAELNMDIFPKSRDYMLKGKLFFVSFVDSPIDKILVGTSFKDDVTVRLKTPASMVHDDKSLRYLTFVLQRPLCMGDTLEMYIEVKNYPNSLLHDNSRVLTEGTYITGQIIPTLGVRQAFLTDENKRTKYGLGKRHLRSLEPSDTTLLGDAFFDNNMRQIEFETKITTSDDQMAFSMGTLVDSRQSKGRNYFHYKSEGKIKNNISWLSGNYEKYTTNFENRKLNIYYHKHHNYNIKDIGEGALASIHYCENWFGSLQHKELNVIEFPATLGSHATLNGNLIPMSESIFLCDIDHRKNISYNHPFFVAAHEIAHYWWGHQIDPANVNGGKLITESIAEYISKRTIENKFGKKVIRENRGKEQDKYFKIRALANDEVPLQFAGLDQDYLNYVKGGLALTCLSDYIGEKTFNCVLYEFVKKHQITKPPYPTSLDLVNLLQKATPDSLQYLIVDLFETITLFDNRILKCTQEENVLNIEIDIRKFRADGSGNKSELTLYKDYIKLALTETDSGVESIKLIKVNKGLNKIKIPIKESITKITIDPEVLLLDANRRDNVFNLRAPEN